MDDYININVDLFCATYWKKVKFPQIVRLLAAVRLEAASLDEALSSQSFGHCVECLCDVFECR